MFRTSYAFPDEGPSGGFENLMYTGIPRWLVARITAADIRDSEKAGRGVSFEAWSGKLFELPR